jgi:hypothetical protein
MILWWRALISHRADFIDRTTPMRSSSTARLAARRPELSAAQRELVFEALARLLPALLREAKKRLVAMPSQVVDDAWHEFILFTPPDQPVPAVLPARTRSLPAPHACRSDALADRCAGGHQARLAVGLPARRHRPAAHRSRCRCSSPSTRCSASPAASPTSSTVLRQRRQAPAAPTAPATSVAAAAVVAAAMATVRLVTGAVAAAAAATEVARVSGQTGPSGLCGRAHWYWSAGRFFQRAHVATSPGETTRS